MEVAVCVNTPTGTPTAGLALHVYFGYSWHSQWQLTMTEQVQRVARETPTAHKTGHCRDPMCDL